MLAAYARSVSDSDPFGGLVIGQRPDPVCPEGWTIVRVRAASLNRHDVWALHGVGLDAGVLPMILGSDAAGIDEDGRPVLVHGLVGNPDWRDDETLDPDRTLLSERHQGTLAEMVAVPRRNLVALPEGFSFTDAACLPTAWLTAYRMLFTQSGLQPGDTVLVQGVAGGVASAAVALGSAAGFRVWATSRDESKRQLALELGAHGAFPTNARLPSKVDAVIETVGEATWNHSIRALRPGGTIVTSGATSGANPAADLTRVFYLQHRVLGSTMGTLEELKKLVSLCVLTGVRPLVAEVLPLESVGDGLRLLAEGRSRGKIVVETP